uniref:ornithine decarboxylase n=1 Tax=Tetradesmus obliquus TaxID=3088 RepID=A0A383V4L4_TETOB|eukprot:jgi/Sobl393_1/12324/SZX59883.1
MASTRILSPNPVEMAPAPSLELSQLDQLCSGNLDALLDGACRIASREGSFSKPQAPPACQAGKVPAAKASAAKKQLMVPRSPSATNCSPERLAKLREANAIVKNSWQYKCTGSARAAAVLAEHRTKRLVTGGPRGLAAQAAALIEQHGLDDTTYIYDLGNTTCLFRAWRAALPRVQPFYAVKCNPEPALMKLLAALGAGFDCASKAELEAVAQMGVPKDQVIFAHPCKRPCDLRYARDTGVSLTTFDTESELTKIAGAYPGIQLVLRIRCDDPEARCPLGLKYGANPEDARKLLASAAALNLAVVGVSFHVGSGCKNLGAYSAAIATARNVFDIGAELGHEMRLLDIGGGFTGHFDGHGHVQFGDIARTINTAIGEHFPAESGVRVIAEPGRYFAETSAALIVPVYGKRDRPTPSGAVHKDYWLTDGLYGSFNCILYDDQKPQPLVLRSPLLPEVAEEQEEQGAGKTFESTLWGPTCDSADYVYKDVQLPELRNGDFLMFCNVGAYTVAGACDFNGIAMTNPIKFFVFSGQAVDDAGETDVEEEESEEESEEEGCGPEAACKAE